MSASRTKGRGRTSARAAARIRRHLRVRKKVSGTAARPRLAITRSARNIFAQLVDDGAGRTLVSASEDGSALVWDVKAAIARAPFRLGAPASEAAWTKLASADPVEAGGAMSELARFPGVALPLLKGKLRPVAAGGVRFAEHQAERRLHLILAEHGYNARFRSAHPVVPNTTYVPSAAAPPGGPAGSSTSATSPRTGGAPRWPRWPSGAWSSTACRGPRSSG